MNIRQAVLIALALLLTGCTTSSYIDRAGVKAGAPKGRCEPSLLVGTFENMSIKSFGPRHSKLWDQLASTGGPWDDTRKRVAASEFSDRVRIKSADGGILMCELISSGAVRESRRVPFTRQGNHLVIETSASFDWLPLGYRSSSSTIALTAVPNGHLLVLHHFKVGGVVMLIGSAGDSGVITFKYPRFDSHGGYTKASQAGFAPERQKP